MFREFSLPKSSHEVDLVPAPVQMIPKVVAQDTVLLINETNEQNVEVRHFVFSVL